MFLEGKTSGTFKSIDEPVYVAFVSPVCISKTLLTLLSFYLVHEEYLLRNHSHGRSWNIHCGQYRLFVQARTPAKELGWGPWDPISGTTVWQVYHLLLEGTRLQWDCSLLWKRHETEVQSGTSFRKHRSGFRGSLGAQRACSVRKLGQDSCLAWKLQHYREVSSGDARIRQIKLFLHCHR